MKGHEEYSELLALSAMDADCEERRALEAHLVSCADCRAEQRELRDAAAALALAAPPVAPSIELRSRLLASLKDVPQDSRLASATSADTTHSDARGRSNVVSLDAARDQRRTRSFASRPAFALAASLVLVALAATSFVLWQRNSALKSQLASLSSTLTQKQDELAARNNELERTRRERELLSSPEAHAAELAGTPAAESARARLVFNDKTGEAMLTAMNLPPAPAGKAYQLWFIADGKPLPGSVFSTDASGRALMHEQIPTEGRRAQIFAVTVEPASGVQSPTGAIVLKGAA